LGKNLQVVVAEGHAAGWLLVASVANGEVAIAAQLVDRVSARMERLTG
jgi:hypothetical protein